MWAEDYEAWEADGALIYADEQNPPVGTMCMIGVSEYVGPNGDRPTGLAASPDNGEGWSGNSDRAIRCYHGWRGTTDDWAFYGHGVRRCLAVRESGNRSRRVVIVFGRDLKAHEE